MAKYRKKALVVSAVQITERTHIPTLEGVMVGEPGDWLITGVHGELYPCKDAVFRATYEPVPAAQFGLLQEQLDAWKAKLTVLEQANCTITAVDDGVHNGQAWISSDGESAEVFPCASCDDQEAYALHEVLHVALRVVKAGDRATEEQLVQDLCQVIMGKCGG